MEVDDGGVHVGCLLLLYPSAVETDSVGGVVDELYLLLLWGELAGELLALYVFEGLLDVGDPFLVYL